MQAEHRWALISSSLRCDNAVYLLTHSERDACDNPSGKMLQPLRSDDREFISEHQGNQDLWADSYFNFGTEGKQI